jgi:hypothetical protein
MKHFSFTPIVVALYLFITPVFSQNAAIGFAVNPKAGIFLWPDHENGGVFGIEANYLRKGWIFSLDFFQFQEINLLSSDEDMFRQVGIMAGKYYGDGLFRVQLQGGFAPTWQIGAPDESDPHFSTVGLVLKTGFKFIPLHFFSIGIDLQGNLNSKKPLFMPLVSIEFGRLRDKINQP